jgi:tetratricopeptide (TPR) repeat protein
MSSGPLPEAAAQRLVAEVFTHLLDERLPPFTWRRFVHDLEAMLPDAPFEIRASVYSAIGLCRARLGQHQEALDAHLSAARWQPNDAGHENNVACSLLLLGRPAEGLEHLRRAHTIAGISSTEKTRLFVNEAQAYLELEELSLAKRAFEMGAGCVQRDDQVNLLNLVEMAAALGRENDCVELFARLLEAVRYGVRGPEQPGAEFILAHGMDALSDAEPLVQDAIRSVLARWEAPTPEEYQDKGQVTLDHDAWARFCESAGLASEP